MSKLPENWGKDTSRNAWNKGNSTQPKKTNPFDKNTPKSVKEQVKPEVAPAKEHPAVTPKAAQPAKSVVTVTPSTKTEPKVEEKQKILPTKEKKNGGKKAIVVVAVVAVLIAVVAAVYFLFIRNNNGEDEISLSSAEESSAEEVQEESETFESREESEKGESSEESEMSEKNELTESSEESESSENSNDEGSSVLSEEDESSSDITEVFDINDYLGVWSYGETRTIYENVQLYDYYVFDFQAVAEDSIYFSLSKYEYSQTGLPYTYNLTNGFVTGRRISESKATLDYYASLVEDFVVINIEFANNTVTMHLDGPAEGMEWELEYVAEHMVFSRPDNEDSSSETGGNDTTENFVINDYMGKWVCGDSHSVIGSFGVATHVYDYEFNVYSTTDNSIYFGISKYDKSHFDEYGLSFSMTGGGVTGRRVSKNKVVFYYYTPTDEKIVVMTVLFENNTVTVSLEGPAEKIGFDTNHLVFHRPDNTVS